MTLDEVIARIPPVDIIITEGYSQEKNPRLRYFVPRPIKSF